MIRQSKLLFSAQSQYVRAYADEMGRVLASIISIINRFSDSSGVIPIRSAQRVITEVQNRITEEYVSRNSTLDSAYAVLLYSYAAQVSRGVVEAHQDHMIRNLSPGAVTWLRSVPSVPVYDPFHLWVDPGGHTLSDRIWKSTLGARQKLDKYLTQNISLGTSSTRMARDLENMLLPNRAVLRSTRPYGVDVSFDSMRLARTEITRAHTETTFIASEANPFVQGMDWALSAQHPRIDICDSLATIGMGGERLRDPYPVDSAPHVVEASHPQCICVNLPNTGNEVETRNNLEDSYRRGESAPLTPLAVGFILGVLNRFVN